MRQGSAYCFLLGYSFQLVFSTADDEYGGSILLQRLGHHQADAYMACVLGPICLTIREAVPNQWHRTHQYGRP